MRRLLAIRDQRIGVVAAQTVAHPLRELGGVRRDRAGAAAIHHEVAQVVRRVSRADHEHAFVAQRLERAAERQVMRRAARRLHGELHDRHVRGGIHPAQRHPRAVIETAAAVDARGDPGFLEQRAGAVRHVGRTGRGVTDVVERAAESRRSRGSSPAARSR
jgi:hypothetical protein